MKLRDRIKNLGYGSEIENWEKLQDHSVGDGDIYRLHFVGYYRFPNNSQEITTSDWPSSVFKMPDNMSEEDGYRVLSYLLDSLKEGLAYGQGIITQISMLDFILSNQERFGFTVLENSKEKRVKDLFIVGGERYLFKNSKFYKKYFNWYQEGVTREEIVAIYKKIGVEFQDINKNDLIAQKKQEKEKQKDYKSTNISNIVDLNKKVEKFINWYYENEIKENYTEVGQAYYPDYVRNLIEKMAVWYELRYPEYAIEQMFGMVYEEKNVDVDKCYAWSRFYNEEAFFGALSLSEKSFFSRPEYHPEIISADFVKSSAHLHLKKDGIVTEADGFETLTGGVVKDKDLEGKYIKEVIQIIQKMGFSLPKGNEMEQTLREYEKQKLIHDAIFECVLYRIIERGNNRIGPRRGLLFAKEFGINIDIPMQYAPDCSDPYLKSFVDEYIKLGGRKDLECYKDYFSRTSRRDKCEKITVEELLSKQQNHDSSPIQKQLKMF